MLIIPIWKRADVHKCDNTDEILIDNIANRFEEIVSLIQSHDKPLGRPSLGQYVSIHSLQAKLIPALLLTPGMEVALYHAGLCWGRAAGKVMIEKFDIKTVEDFVNRTKLVTQILGLQIPELRAVQKDKDGEIKSITVRLYECSDCYGLPKVNMPLCYFETGKWAGGMEILLQKQMEGIEKKCSGLGDEFCEIEIKEK